MGKIALEEHFVMDSPEHVERWLSLVPMMPAALHRKTVDELADLGDGRLEKMEAAGVDQVVLSNVGSVQGILDPTPALRLAREANDFLAEAVRARPDRYAAFATVPLQDPAAGADELQRAVEQLGLKGTMLFGSTDSQYLDNERYAPFWERAQALDVPVYLHAADAAVLPASMAGCPELEGATWSWTAETATHALRMVFGGVFERFPRVRLILGHMGETLPYQLWRLDQRAKAWSSDQGSTSPSELIRRNVTLTTSGMFSDEPLQCALAALGADSIMFSVDYPFESMQEASGWLDKAKLDDTTRAQVEQGNARKLLRL